MTVNTDLENSTESAILRCYNRIITNIETNKIPLNIYLDLSKAFDTINHNILLHKLRHYGIEGTSYNLLENYLTNHMQYVEYQKASSSILFITAGVPQGSILGPLLFLIYMNDFPKASKQINFIIYAYDTTLSTTIEGNSNDNKTVHNINRELKNINDWLKVNKLSLNIKINKFTIFHHLNKK